MEAAIFVQTGLLQREARVDLGVEIGQFVDASHYIGGMLLSSMKDADFNPVDRACLESVYTILQRLDTLMPGGGSMTPLAELRRRGESHAALWREIYRAMKARLEAADGEERGPETAV